MSGEIESSAWIVKHPGLTLLALVTGLLALAVLLPYLQFVLFGVVLAYIAFPAQRRIEQYVSSTTGAVATITAVLFLILLPLVFTLSIAVRQSLMLERAIRSGRFDVAAIETFFEAAGYTVDISALYASNQERIASAIRMITSGLLDLAGSLPRLFIGLTITLFVLFALLRSGRELVAWVQWVLPISDDVLDELRVGFDQLMWASVVGNVSVAAIQAVLLGIGLAIAGLPAVIFLTVATFVLTLLPLVGAFGVWLPAVVYLVATGQPVVGVIVGVYGILISVSDVYLRPALIGQTGAFNSATIVIGIFGGLTVFGAVGLFIGPVVIGGAKLVFDCFARTHTGTSPS